MNSYAEAVDTALQVRKAELADVPAILELINGYAAEGIMLPRTQENLAARISEFFVSEGPSGLIGCAAMHVYTSTSAEVRSLAVARDQKARGAGRRLVEAIEEEARAMGLHSLFAFTYVTGFFEKLGFTEVDRAELPLKVWKDCLRCPKFRACDEVAMIKRLKPEPAVRADLGEDFVLLPILRKN